MTNELWQTLRTEAQEVIKQEPLLASYVYACVLNHDSLEGALSFILAYKLTDDVMPAVTVRELFEQAFAGSPTLIEEAILDLKAVYERDAATNTYLPVILYLKGFQSIQVHRLAHFLWKNGRRDLAQFIQSRNSEVFGVDIHPACVMGKGIMFDHATGIVIGETTVIDDNVSILQQVTLGGTGNEQGDRHPKIKSGVLIAAGAKVLGNITIGEGAKIGAGSVVLKDVEPHTTVVGVPARSVGKACTDETPSQTMNQNVFDDDEAS
ncbi:MAG: serine O-acetyltransferase [Gammaproteobacteria bacterium]